MGLSLTEILVIFIVVLLLFGARKIPELARSLGRASYEFKKAKEDIIRETRDLTEASESAAKAEASVQKKQPETSEKS